MMKRPPAAGEIGLLAHDLRPVVPGQEQQVVGRSASIRSGRHDRHLHPRHVKAVLVRVPVGDPEQVLGADAEMLSRIVPFAAAP